MMRDWLPYQDEFQHEILCLEGPALDDSCKSCGKPGCGKYRCTDCRSSGLWCQDCCVRDHASHPFHSISQWTGTYFQPTTLRAIGFVLHLGHETLPCPHWTADETGGGDFTVVDVDGVYVHQVAWCQCRDAPDRWRQLLRMRLYPATVQFPRSAFTFRLLRYYNIDTLECNTSTASFMSKLRRLTNLYHPLTVPVSLI